MTAPGLPTCPICRTDNPDSFCGSCQSCRARKARMEAQRVSDPSAAQVAGLDSTTQPLKLRR